MNKVIVGFMGFVAVMIVCALSIGGFFAYNTYQKDVMEAFDTCMDDLTSYPGAHRRTQDEIAGACSEFARAYVFKRDFEVDGKVYTWNKRSMKYVFK